MSLVAPFPFFGGKRSVAEAVWRRFGTPKQYIEPFCGSAAILLASPKIASLEIVNDASGFIANFWRAVQHDPQAVAHYADYPILHVDMGARRQWLLAQREHLSVNLQDPHWPGNPEAAGWWLWGHCACGMTWCDWLDSPGTAKEFVAGPDVLARGTRPNLSNCGKGIHAATREQADDPDGQFLTTSGRVASYWLKLLADRLERVRVTHGDWTRCLYHYYGGNDTAVFLDPPYDGHENLYGDSEPVSAAVGEWVKANSNLRIALCGHLGEYDLPDWEEWVWNQPASAYCGNKSTVTETIWFSPACLRTDMPNLFVDLSAERSVDLSY